MPRKPAKKKARKKPGPAKGSKPKKLLPEPARDKMISAGIQADKAARARKPRRKPLKDFKFFLMEEKKSSRHELLMLKGNANLMEDLSQWQVQRMPRRIKDGLLEGLSLKSALRRELDGQYSLYVKNSAQSRRVSARQNMAFLLRKIDYLVKLIQTPSMLADLEKQLDRMERY